MPSKILLFSYILRPVNEEPQQLSPCHFSPLAEIPGSIELLENSLTYEEVQWRKIIHCFIRSFSQKDFSKTMAYSIFIQLNFAGKRFVLDKISPLVLVLKAFDTKP